MISSKNNIKRRIIAVKKRNDSDVKAKTVRAGDKVPNLDLYPGEASLNSMEQNYQKKKRQERGRSCLGSSEKSIQTNLYVRYDREAIFFFPLPYLEQRLL